MIDSDPYVVRTHDRPAAVRFLEYGLWLYLVALSVATGYTVCWVVGVVDGVTTTTLGVAWVAITSMGAAYLLLVPVFFRDRFALY